MKESGSNKSGGFPVLLIGALLLVLALSWSRSQVRGKDLGWQASVDAAISQAEEAKQPVLVAFHGPHCPPCHAMERNVLSAATVEAELSQFVPVMVNAFEDFETSARFDVYATPTYLILDAAHSPCLSAAGYLEADAFNAFLKQGMVAFQQSVNQLNADGQPAPEPKP